MSNTIIGIYTDREDANNALAKLADAGVSNDDISVVVQEGDYTTELADYDDDDSVAEGALEGAATGGVIGGVLGLLVGLTAITVPGLGALFVGGPLAAALGLTGAAATTASGAVTGALAGGLVGALVNLGVPEEEAQIYEERVKAGDILLAVDVDEDMEDEIREVMVNTNAEEVSSYEFS